MYLHILRLAITNMAAAAAVWISEKRKIQGWILFSIISKINEN